MKTYPMKSDKDGFQYGFEIENAYISIGKIVKLLRTIKGVSNIKKRRLFDMSNPYHVAFDYFGCEFIVLEPHGDSSVYWICPAIQDGEIARLDITEIEAAFKRYSIPFVIKLFGDILTFQLFRSRGELQFQPILSLLKRLLNKFGQ